MLPLVQIDVALCQFLMFNHLLLKVTNTATKVNPRIDSRKVPKSAKASETKILLKEK